METLSDKISTVNFLEGGITVDDVKQFIKDLKEFLESAAEHGEGCRCPMRMNKYAKNAILNKIDYLAGDKLI